jgi:hypothetical protein
MAINPSTLKALLGRGIDEETANVLADGRNLKEIQALGRDGLQELGLTLEKADTVLTALARPRRAAPAKRVKVGAPARGVRAPRRAVDEGRDRAA